MSPPAAAAPAGLMAPNAKRYTLAALLATLAVAVVVTVSFVVLCPAQISFSVARAGSHYRSGGGAAAAAGSVLRLTLTLAASNPSGRATVTYKSMFVDVSNSTAAQKASWVSATVTTAMPLEQPTNSVATVDASVDLVDSGVWMQEFTGNMTSSFSVMVTAQARFKVGVAWTRLYDIKVACRPVSFFPHTSANQPGGGGAPGGDAGGHLPVSCL